MIKYWRLISVLLILLIFFIGCSRQSDDIPGLDDVDTSADLIEKGWENYENSDFQSAIDNFTQVLDNQVDPAKVMGAYQGLGWTYSRVQSYDAAIANFQFVISAEYASSGKLPIIHTDTLQVTAIDSSDTEWILKSNDNYIVGVNEIVNKGARRVGEFVGVFEPHPGGLYSYIIKENTCMLTLNYTNISNNAGTALGTASDNSVVFDTTTCIFTKKVENETLIDSLEKYSVNPEDGQVPIYCIQEIHHATQLLDIVDVKINYRYEEIRYIIEHSQWQQISLSNTLNTEASDSDTPADQTGDFYYLNCDVYDSKENASDDIYGGTYHQADAYAGMAASYYADGNHKQTAAACCAIIYINEDLDEPYIRNLYEDDSGLDMWDIYYMLAKILKSLVDITPPTKSEII